MNKKIIMLTGGGESTTLIYNGLKDNFYISNVIVEENVSRKKLLKGRIKRMGYLKVFGQVLFRLCIPKILEWSSKKRIKEIKENYALDNSPIPPSLIKKVSSVNSKKCIEFLKQEKPDLIIVNGTRIISKKVLKSVDATLLNTHAGITPKYRGVHGGYWAMASQDIENCGVTVHYIDSGIDTGGVLFQQNISPISKDNFVTYVYLQLGEGLKIMNKAISNFMNNKLEEKEPQTKESKLWYHPTIWFYLYKRITKGIK